LKKFKKFLETIFDFGMYLNVLIILPQPITIIANQNANNVSIWMWLACFIFQAFISLHGKINLKSKSMFIGMGISAIFSLLTMILCLVY